MLFTCTSLQTPNDVRLNTWVHTTVTKQCKPDSSKHSKFEHHGRKLTKCIIFEITIKTIINSAHTSYRFKVLIAIECVSYNLKGNKITVRNKSKKLSMYLRCLPRFDSGIIGHIRPRCPLFSRIEHFPFLLGILLTYRCMLRKNVLVESTATYFTRFKIHTS